MAENASSTNRSTVEVSCYRLRVPFKSVDGYRAGFACQLSSDVVQLGDSLICFDARTPRCADPFRV